MMGGDVFSPENVLGTLESLREELALRNQRIDALKRGLEDAAAALDDIVDAEKSDGYRNSYPAQVARGAARKARGVLLPGEGEGER